MLAKLSEVQNRPLRNGAHNNVVKLDVVELPKFVLDVLSLGPKHPVRDKFTKVQILADAELNEIICAVQFETCKGESDDLTIKSEKLIIISLHNLL